MEELEELNEEIINSAECAANKTLPSVSKKRYCNVYEEFKTWKTAKKVKGNCEKILLAFFNEQSKQKKPSSVWAYYSMLKSMVKLKDNVDISSYHTLTAFLKTNASGYEPNKAKVFTEMEIKKFTSEADDYDWLDVKVNIGFSVSIEILIFFVILGCLHFWYLWCYERG